MEPGSGLSASPAPSVEAVQIVVDGGMVVLDPLVTRLRWMRSAAFRSQAAVAIEGTLVMTVVAFVYALEAAHLPQANAMLACFLCWLSGVLEPGAFLQPEDVDPVDIPVLMGRVRVRGIDPLLKQGVMDLVGKDKLTKSSAAAAKILQRFRHWGGTMFASRSAQRWERPQVAAYLAWAASRLQAACPKVLHISWDATRLGGKDTVWLAVTDPEGCGAIWAPPQVHRLVDAFAAAEKHN